MGAHSKINAISLNIKINKPISVHNKCTKFYAKILSPSENIV